MEFKDNKLFGLSNKKKLADMLKVDKKTLKKVRLEYIPYKLPDESSMINDKLRNLYNPNKIHKQALKSLVNYLSHTPIPSYVYGGIKKRSHIQNATVHKNKKYLMLIDIKDFFPSTSDFYVYKLFTHHFKMEQDLAKILTDFVTIPCENREGRYLPQGYPTSPILSYLAYEQMYNRLHKLAEDNQLEFTCYYDDLTFSSNKFINKSLKRHCASIIKDYGFEIHSLKSKVMIKNGVEVTGVFLDQSGKIKPTKKLLQKLQDCYEKMIFMDTCPQDFSKDEFIFILNRFLGLISAIKSIQNERNLELYENKSRYIRKKYNLPYR